MSEKDWRTELLTSAGTLAELSRIAPNQWKSSPEVEAAASGFPVLVSAYYASLIDRDDPNDPIALQCIPSARELLRHPGLHDDPLTEDSSMPIPGVVRRYRDRILVLLTNRCATFCRHCTRRRRTGRALLDPMNPRLLASYLKENPAIVDVLISGGDPLVLETEALDEVLGAIRSVNSVKWIRIATRVPVVLPSRLDDELAAMLSRHNPVYVNTHFNHPRELTAEAMNGCARLIDRGIQVSNQTVLLRGVNDDLETLKSLFYGLTEHRIRAYYVFQPDLTQGTDHLRPRLSDSLALVTRLQGEISGMAMPRFAVDLPGCASKTMLSPGNVICREQDCLITLPDGTTLSYPEPIW